MPLPPYKLRLKAGSVHSSTMFLMLCLIILAGTSAVPAGAVMSLNISSSTLMSTRNLTKLLHVSKSRAQVLQQQLVPSTEITPSAPGSSVLYYVSLEIGTPPLRTNLAMDTVIPLTWVQSAQCQTCFPLSIPNYDPLKSTTFEDMPPNHTYCVAPIAAPEGNFCIYDLGVSLGDMAFDMFSVASFVPTRLAFGSGIFNDLVSTQDNLVAGMLGLGKGHPSSLVTQLSQFTLNRYSYCLPLDDQLVQVHHPTLDFGIEATLSGDKVRTTAIFEGPPGPMGTFNYLNWSGVSVSHMEHSVFVQGRGGLVVDTASPFTLLVEDVYQHFQQAVTDYFKKQYGWSPMPAGTSKSGFELCYNEKVVDPIEFPKLEVNFKEGATLLLHQSFQVDQVSSELQQVCLLVLPIRGGDQGLPSIIGAVQQATYRFLYDLNESKLSFAPDQC